MFGLMDLSARRDLNTHASACERIATRQIYFGRFCFCYVFRCIKKMKVHETYQPRLSYIISWFCFVESHLDLSGI